jgi:hypothetical protein
VSGLRSAPVPPIRQEVKDGPVVPDGIASGRQRGHEHVGFDPRDTRRRRAKPLLGHDERRWGQDIEERPRRDAEVTEALQDEAGSSARSPLPVLGQLRLGSSWREMAICRYTVATRGRPAGNEVEIERGEDDFENWIRQAQNAGVLGEQLDRAEKRLDGLMALQPDAERSHDMR